MPLVPLLGEVLTSEIPGSLGAFLSGAGPSIALLAHRDFARIEQQLSSMYERAGVPVTVRTLGVHQEYAAGQAEAPPLHATAPTPRPVHSEHTPDAFASVPGRTV